jgi:hypothetical protein
MKTIDNIMKLARECEFVAGDSEAYDRCRQALRTAIEQALTPGEPTAWLESPYGSIRMNPNMRMDFPPQSLKWRIPLYTAPQPQREWVGLTPDERDALVQRADALLDHIYEYGTASEGIRPRLKSLFTAVEAKLREKNGGGV